MRLLSAQKKIIFDGEYEAFARLEKEVAIGSLFFQVPFSDLKPLGSVTHEDIALSADDIAEAIGCSVVDFGGMKSYKGTKPGLKLHFYAAEADGQLFILVFSLGEFQPGRFLCQLEGCFEAGE